MKAKSTIPGGGSWQSRIRRLEERIHDMIESKEGVDGAGDWDREELVGGF
jgi:hypothetical protein